MIDIIGQNQLRKHLDNIIDNDKFPRFTIIVGPEGSGKKTICRYIAERMYLYWCYEPDNKVETVRNAIWDAYKVSSPTMYVFTDVDDMSMQAKNAMLKVTEEPPNNAYFIMTVSDLNNVLDTIKSRATVLYMQTYTASELTEYAKRYNDSDLYAHICTNPGDVDKLHEMGVKEFYDYVGKVVDNIAYVSLANAFKIANKIALKPDAEGYDMRLFLVVFIKICVDRMTEDIEVADENKYWVDGIKIASKIATQMRVTGISKSMLLDRFILEIRRVWG